LYACNIHHALIAWAGGHVENMGMLSIIRSRIQVVLPVVLRVPNLLGSGWNVRMGYSKDLPKG